MARLNVCDISFSSDDDEEIINFIERPIRRPRILYERQDHFHMYDDLDFITRFRISKISVMVLEQIDVQLEFHHDKNNCVSPMNQLLLALRFYATGSHLIVAGDFMGVSKSTVCRIVHRVTDAIAALRPRYINLPTEPEAIETIQRHFYDLYRFPRIIGAMDCTHIKIQSPGGNNAKVFRNRKGYFSINVQTIGDARLQFRDIVARWPGSVHDKTIFNNSEKRAMFEAGMFGNGILLADSGYPVRPYLLPPLDQCTNAAEQRYNECQIRTRACVERKYGIWKRKFPILALGMRVQVHRALDIIVACAVLHNVSRLNQDMEPPNLIENMQARIDEGQMPDQVRINTALADNRNGANIIRRAIINEFFQTVV